MRPRAFAAALLYPLASVHAQDAGGAPPVDPAFLYTELAVETLASPQVLFLVALGLIMWLRPKLLDRIAMLDVAGVKLQLRELKETVDKTQKHIESLEVQIQEDYVEASQALDPIASVEDVDKLGTYLKAVAASLDDIDFALDYLKVGEKEGKVYGAGCAIQVRPQPKFCEPIAEYLTALAGTRNLDNIRLRVVYKVVQALEKILRSDNRKETRALDEHARTAAINALDKLAKHRRCVEDDKRNGRRGIVYRINVATGLAKQAAR